MAKFSPERMTLQVELLPPKKRAQYDKIILPVLKRFNLAIEDVSEPFQSLMHPLQLDRIKEGRFFHISIHGSSIRTFRVSSNRKKRLPVTVLDVEGEGV